MRVLVTGAAGFIGSHLAERLRADGVSVHGVDRLSDYYDPALKRQNLSALLDDEGFTFSEGSLNELDLEQLLDEADVVYHLAGQPGVRVSWGEEFALYLDDNVLSTQRLLEVARGRQVDRFVLASSSSIYGDAENFPTSESATPAPVSPYGVTKLAAEHLCGLYYKGFGVPTVALRYFTIFGPRQRPDMAFNRFIRFGIEGRSLEVFGDGLQERDFTYVDDAVSATIAAGSKGKPGNVYNIAGGNHATVNEVLETLGELIGEQLQIEMLPAVVGDARKTGADTSRAKSDLGYAPKVSLREGLSRQLEAERSRQG
ncbi:MAG: NAD-dependent epimerase/dehydratase family protein [Solirubrobacterales bacterium]